MTEQTYDYTIAIPIQLNSTVTRYDLFAAYFSQLSMLYDSCIAIDFSRTTFISGDLFAILGAIFNENSSQNNNNLFLTGLTPKVKRLIETNGFGTQLGLKKIPDSRKSSMDYKFFHATTDDIVSFEKYIIMNFFDKYELPNMSSGVRNSITDNFLEIFNNVIDHTKSKYVYVCGDYNKNKHKLIFTITNIGTTISENVTDYLIRHMIPLPSNTLEWATEPGNSTKSSSAPGGLGLNILLDFLEINNGCFRLHSGNEFLDINQNKKRFGNSKNNFPGTIVSVTINLNDHAFYQLVSEKDTPIQF